MNDTAWVKSIDSVELKGSALLKGKWARMVDLSSPQARGLIFIVGEIEPGMATGWHEHPEDEVFLVLSGHGVVRWRLEDQQYEAAVEPGSAFFKRGGIAHEMEASTDAPLFGIGVKV
ncbi:MAG: cupin domain-containing protein [Anaerolinea sp.]|nr:cupin domain-containing protein [Anaerolinea sp.]